MFLRGIPKADLYPAFVTPSPDVKATAKVASKASVAGVPAKAIHAKVPAYVNDEENGKPCRVKDGFIISRVWSLIAVYFFVRYATVIVSYYTPFLMQFDGMSDSGCRICNRDFLSCRLSPGLYSAFMS